MQEDPRARKKRPLLFVLFLVVLGAGVVIASTASFVAGFIAVVASGVIWIASGYTGGGGSDSPDGGGGFFGTGGHDTGGGDGGGVS